MTQLRITTQQRKDRARVIVKASKKTGDILPRHIYERAGAPVPHNATTNSSAQSTGYAHCGR